MKARIPIRVAAAVAVLAALAAPSRGAEETFVFDKAHSTLGFRIRHVVTKINGRFKDFDGMIWIDRQNAAASKVELTIRAASIDTSNDNRDQDLRSANFFEVEKFPTITFKSTKIEPKGSDAFVVTGDLTMHGVTKSIQVPVTSNGFAKMGKTEKAGFSVSFPLNRKDYGVTWNRTLDQGGLLLGEDVEIVIEVEANKKEAEAPKAGSGR
ncbi:MAG TPA: YceI family protein [Thermoanaerobaculia bacterium]|nr:YceI family protein [Thermoanaerobaculia bacterium]